jgi:6,7-dimethyl-8-ribityllumazine synthase
MKKESSSINSESFDKLRMTKPDCSGKRFAIVVARFYESLANWLEDGARRALADCGVRAEDVAVYHVPGCFELPLAAKRIIAADDRIDAIVALGVVVRGETPHFDYVAGECARGIMTVQLATGVPIGFGVLTTENLAQAEERADPQRGDKGYEAAIAAACLLQVPKQPAREVLGFRR